MGPSKGDRPLSNALISVWSMPRVASFRNSGSGLTFDIELSQGSIDSEETTRRFQVALLAPLRALL